MTISYSILCDQPNCENKAELKIAAEWSDSLTSELKTYALTCQDCLETAFHQSQQRRANCRLAKHEKLGDLGIYELTQETGARERKRRSDLEEQFS